MVRARLVRQRRILRICLNILKHVDVSWVIWRLIDIVVSRYNPRSLTVSTGSMMSEPIVKWLLAIRWRRRDVLHHITSVFDVFCCSRLDAIQSALSAPQFSIRWRNIDVAEAVGWHEPTICMSSAYICGFSPYRSTSATRSAVYMINRNGPRTDPCGTPQSTIISSEMLWCWQPCQRRICWIHYQSAMCSRRIISVEHVAEWLIFDLKVLLLKSVFWFVLGTNYNLF